ncbi:FAD-linked sulfhydryl oxidase ALR isoform X2 [Parasteatoda tepidariorum]|uniref:FAD-linked sulfhydryl oxidase ALR isoform X2 n=1 Tax=Parasteatoda tepidariorum TaxID=114398 RepID=UPI00077F99F5|nr:FAD-linked sulfhydryl oxidase ALR-like isoform X2 [Parasteatoda tepidariorum]
MSSRYSHYNDSKPEKCRACTDFKTWTKQQSNSQNKKILENGKLEVSKECPLDREELGKNTWSFLHTLAAYFPDKPSEGQKTDMKTFITLFSKFYPCKICAEDMQKDLTTDPPAVNSRHDLSQWMCQYHNKVNEKLGKPLFDCSKVDERWLHGWKDGSCD